MVFLFNVRRGLLAGAALVLGGLGCDGTSSESPDAGTAAAADATHSVCATVSDDLSPSAQAGALDGIYQYVEGEGELARPLCIVSDDGRTVRQLYATLDHEHFTTYFRVYPYAQGCGTAFDSGGQIQVSNEGVLRSCDRTYNSAHGTFRQAVFLSKLDSGEVFRSYQFYGEGPTDPRWRELIVSTLSSNNPFERAPVDLNFGHFRRPK